MARSEAGAAGPEDHPAGYRIVRVPVSAVAGLPWPLRPLVVGWRRRRPRRRCDRARRPRPPSGEASPRAGGGRPAPSRGPPRDRRPSSGSRRSRLTVRSQRLATRPLAPHADLVHAMAYMGIPIGPRPGPARRAPVVYDARDIYVDAREHRPAARSAAPAVRRDRAALGAAGARVITVNEPYADVMAGGFGVALPLDRHELLVPPRAAAPPRPRRFHERARPGRPTRVVLYHGGLSPRPRDRAADRGAAGPVAGRPPRPPGLRRARGRARARRRASPEPAAGCTSCRPSRRPSCSTGSPPPTSWRCRSSRRR